MPRPHPRDLAAPLNALQEELHRLVERYRGHVPFAESGPWSPAVDLYETQDEVGVLIDLPGVEPSSVDLTVSGRTLTIRGEKPAEGYPKGQGRTLERATGPFHREIELGADVDIEAIEAEAANGVLRIRLPKAQGARARTIPVRTS